MWPKSKKNKIEVTDHGSFLDDAKRYATPVVELCHFALDNHREKRFPCRDFLSRLHTESTRLEELVDHYGAQTNEKWFPFRETVAAAKLFSSVIYSVMHIQQSFARYRLLDIDADCSAQTEKVLKQLKKALFTICHNIIDQTQRCDIHDPHEEPDIKPCEERNISFRLPADRQVRHVARVGEVVVYLATQFLNLAEDRDVNEALAEREDKSYENHVPEPINEERLRIVEARFHNLQSMYDTYIFESDVEQQDSNLLFLRGHISVIYHLLATATELVHYYVRHMSSFRRQTEEKLELPMSNSEILGLLFDYTLRNSQLYLDSAIQLCHTMVQSYSEQTEIEVPIPNYRGFHVRPSTLIAKIVAHYGSTVKMILNDQEYDASSPLNLFRANEEINAMKRRTIADMLNKRPDLDAPIPEDSEERKQRLQLLFVALMNEDKIVIYDTDLSFEGIEDAPEHTVSELATRFIRHYMSIGKLDVESDLTVKFVGDNRALKDLEILANNGYGEDHMGNNIVLPDELGYLARQR